MQKKKPVFGRSMVIAAALLCAAYFTPPAYANPEDGVVTGGSATISENGKTLDVHQHSSRAVIDWRSFNIEIDEHTQFHQPSSSSIILNRVNSGDPSRILGQLTANGNVILVNPNGVFFGQDSRVDVNGLIATTADIDTPAFMNGGNDFNKPGNPDATITNEGYITAKEAGLIGLVAPNVINNGVIEARLGRVELASGDTATLDFYGDGLLKVEVNDDRLTSQKIVHTGVLHAEGGTVSITAAAARNTIDSLIEVKGELKAPRVAQRGGKIIIQDKNDAGQVLVSAKLDASGMEEDGKGGDVEILGGHVGLMAGTHIDATGMNGGGQVLVGGDFQGQGDIQTARMTYVDEDALIEVKAHEDGNGGRAIIWADDTTRYYGRINADGGNQFGDGGFVEVSGKGYLDFNGTVTTLAQNGETGTLLLDPTDITISNAVNSNVNGATPFSPNIDDGPSNLNVTTLQTALASANVIVQTRATGSQLGDITVVDPIAWSANRSLTLDAHNKIYIDASITARNALVLTANDVDINANLIEHASGANLTIQPKTASTTIGVAGGAGMLNLSTADLNFIQPGWNNIIIGATNGTGIMDVGARSWNAPLTLRSSTGEIQINGAQTMGARAMALTTRNLSINANLSGTSTLTIDPGANVTVGIAGEAGTLNLTTAELDFIQNGFSGITIGRAANTQTQRVGSYTWNDPLTLRTGTGQLNIVGTPTMGANNLTLATRNLASSADLIGTGTLTISPDGNQTVGVAGAAGTFQITNAILDRIIDGWGLVSLGLSSNTAAMNIGARTWTDSARFVNGTGLITVSGAQDVGGNNLTITSRGDVDINAPLTGGNVLTLRPVLDTVSTGVAGGAGTFNLSMDDLNNITDGWARIDIGLATNDQPINVNAYTWNDSVRFLNDGGIITINGSQNLGSNSLTIHSDANPVINAPLIGTGTLTFEQDATGTTMGIAGGAGTYNISTAELAHINDGWNQIIFGRTNSTGAMNINAATWLDSVLFQTAAGVITIAGDQDVGSNDLWIRSNGNPAINGTLTGTGTLTLDTVTATTTIGVAGGAGTYNLSAVELGRITDGWSNIVIGNAAGTGAMAVNAYSWDDNLSLMTSTGVITIAGDQNLGANDLTIQSSGNPAINADLIGTGTLSFRTNAANSTIGLAGATGTLNLSVAELNRIDAGWQQLNIGREDGTGALLANTYNWNHDVLFQTLTGQIRFVQAQDFGANDISIISNGDTRIDANLTGVGDLVISTQTASGTIGLAGGAGTMNLAAAELTRLVDGWNSITIGRTDSTANMTLNAYTNWRDDISLLNGTGSILLNGDQSVINDGSLRFDGDVVLNNNRLMTSAGGDIVFDQDIDGGGFDLTLNAPTANITLGTAGNIDELSVEANDIILNGAISVDGAGDSLVLAASGNFTNNAGAAALDASNGRWLIYSTDPALNQRDGLLPDASEFGMTFGANPPATIGAGNRFLYSTAIAPQLSVSADNLNRNFGLDNPPLTYSFNAGDLVAGDSIADALDLTLETAASSSSPAGTYAITAASINSVLGYQINFIDGLLTVSAQADANLPSNYEGERSIAGLPIDIEASFFAPYLPSSAADYYEQDWLYIPGLKFMIESDLAEEFSLMQDARFKERQ